MASQKTIGILLSILLVAALVTIPAFDHASASKLKSYKNMSNTTKTSHKSSRNTSDNTDQKPKSIEQKNSRTESRHKTMHKITN